MDAVSVREPSGIDLCREHLGVEAQCVLDPTMLVDAQDYESLIDSSENEDQGYLAVYCLDITSAKKAFFEKLAQDRGLEARYFSAGWFAEITVKEWLSMLRYATMVVSDSFHGTVFSILFGKEFYTLGNPKRGNTRIMGLLEPLGLEGRLVSDTEPVEPADSHIDWDEVYARLAEKRQESLEFLARSLQEQYVLSCMASC